MRLEHLQQRADAKLADIALAIMLFGAATASGCLTLFNANSHANAANSPLPTVPPVLSQLSRLHMRRHNNTTSAER